MCWNLLYILFLFFPLFFFFCQFDFFVVVERWKERDETVRVELGKMCMGLYREWQEDERMKMNKG